MPTETRTDRVPERLVPVTAELWYNPFSDPDPGPINTYYVMPSFVTKYQKRSNDGPQASKETVLSFAEQSGKSTRSRRNPNLWNSFSHFRSDCVYPKAEVSLPVHYSHAFQGFRGYVRGNSSFAYGYTDADEITSVFPFGEAGRFDLNLPIFGDESDGVEFVPRPEGLDDINQLALKRLLPIIKSELSLINSIIELKDFRSFARNTKLTLASIRRILGGLFGHRPLKPKETLADIAREIGGNFLAWKFAIQPLISDIRGIQASLSRFESRINDFVTRAGRVQKKHYTFSWVEFPDIIGETYSPVSWRFDTEENHQNQFVPLTSYTLRRNVRYAPTTFHAEIQYNYNYTSYQEQHAAILSLLDRFGVNFNPEIVWNAIPWSFVVDWFARINVFFSRFEVSLMEPQINILRYLWSVNRSRVIQVSRQAEPVFAVGADIPVNKPEYLFPAVRQSSYRRMVELPRPSWFSTSGLNSKEFTLAAALVVSRHRPRHQRRR